MRSPFPGMDPWLERHWRDVHSSLIIYIRDLLQQQLPEPLVARAEEDVSVDIEEEGRSFLRPDVDVVEEPLGSGGVSTLAPRVVLAEPLLLRVPEPEVNRRVEIIDPSSGGRVVTAIEVLSPANKLAGRDRLAYQSKQRDFAASGVNLVEIDLVRKGDWVFAVDESLVPMDKRAPYRVCVFRATRPDVRALYLAPLRQPLPHIPIPLRPRDRDVALDLQQVIDQAYESGRYGRTDYRHPLDPPLPPADASWAAELLRRAGRVP